MHKLQQRETWVSYQRKPKQKEWSEIQTENRILFKIYIHPNTQGRAKDMLQFEIDQINTSDLDTTVFSSNLLPDKCSESNSGWDSNKCTGNSWYTFYLLTSAFTQIILLSNIILDTNILCLVLKMLNNI